MENVTNKFRMVMKGAAGTWKGVGYTMKNGGDVLFLELIKRRLLAGVIQLVYCGMFMQNKHEIHLSRKIMRTQ